MKLRSTTPVSADTSSLAKKAIIIASAILMVSAGPMALVPRTAHADTLAQINQQIQILKQQQNDYQNSANHLQASVNTLQGKIASLQLKQAQIQNQINLTQAEVDALQKKIQLTQAQIEDNQNALGMILANIYVDGQTTPLEMLASSKNISDYIDQQSYQSGMSQQLQTTINKVNQLKAQLEQQQISIKQTLSNQKNAKAALISTQEQQQAILDQTKGQEATYQRIIANNQAQQNSLAAKAQAAMAATASSGSLIAAGSAASGGYPWNDSNCPMDGWTSTGGTDGNGSDGYGYGCRQCASYVAWRVAKETGFYPVNWGNAADFPASAAAAGYSNGPAPHPGSIAVMSPMQANGDPNGPGHVAWVDAVSADGSMVTVSQYNWYNNGWGNYTEMSVPTSDFYTYIYILH